MKTKKIRPHQIPALCLPGNPLAVPSKSKKVFFDFKKACLFLGLLISFTLLSTTIWAQLGVYQFTGAKACPTQNPSVTSQPLNATFTNFSSVNTKCKTDNDNICAHEEWNTTGIINRSEYHEFSVTANANYYLNLTSLSFTQYIKDEDAGNTTWIIRSSLDNYSSNIATGIALETAQTPTVLLPAASFSGVSSVTFRIYLINSKDNSNFWVVDEVRLNGAVVLVPAAPANPTSNSPQCVSNGVTMHFTGSAPAGETWFWQTSATGTSTANSTSSYNVTLSGTYYVRAQNNTTLEWSNGAGSITVSVTTGPDVSAPVFDEGPNSARCQGAGTVTYLATASNATGITYSLDATSLAYGNTINSATGAVTFAFNWNGSSTITATAEGCNGPLSSDHEVEILAFVNTPVFDAGPSSVRCQGAETINYNASADNATGLTYSLDAGSLAAGITIDANTGDVTFDASWFGTSVITVEAVGCNGPKSATHTIDTRGMVATPVFTLGSTSNRCKGGATVVYTANAANAASVIYSLDAASITGGVTINGTTGAVTYPNGWTGTSVITATATGCSGPTSATHNASSWNDVNNPVYSIGNSSTRCQGAGTVTYTATEANAWAGISYGLDAASLAAGNTIDTATGAVTYTAGWSGSSKITVTAKGCGGQKTKDHDVTTTPYVQAPVFEWGASSIRCQKGETTNYKSTAANNTSITYTLDAASLAAGNSITTGGGGSEGRVTFTAGWTGTSVVTAIASGCNGPVSTTHSITTTPSVAAPVLTLGSGSTRCQGAGSVTYTASAANNTGITYSLNAPALSAGNTINASTGQVTYVAGWTGATVITASATGCGGPLTGTHTVTITPYVGTPVFTAGATSSRCQGAGAVTFTANASNSTSVSYSLDATSLAAGNTINGSTGAVSFAAGWTGVSTITANATGCGSPTSANHVVTTNPPVTTPVFTLGASSFRCLGFGTVTYAATSSNSTGINYSLDATSLSAGNTINSATGAVNYTLLWVGTSTITASASGCAGPFTAIHTVTINGAVTTPVFTMGSSSTRCQGAGTVTYTANANNTSGITYSLNAGSITAGNTINSATGLVTYVAGWSGTTTITASAAGCNGPRTANHTVTVTPTVGTPVFTTGPTSTRCQGAGSVDYTANASNITGKTYSLDAASLAAGNTINSVNGIVNYVAGWSGTSIVTCTVTGCNGPASSNHTVTITPTVGTPVFTAGSTSIRCQGAGTVVYGAAAAYTTGISYSLNAASISGGNSINSGTGSVNWTAGWSGTSTITASAAGCNGPRTAIHTVTITPTVGLPVFTLGATSSRCQGANSVIYTATATNNTGISYSLDATSISGGNSINSATGEVTYQADWTGTSIITASATGCNGPRSSNHTVTTNITVGATVFTLGATSIRCQGGNSVTYTATAPNSTSISYALDAASTSGGNTINAMTGAVVYAAGWSGTTTITATAAGCNGPTSDIHTVTITPTVGTPVFISGSTSTRCQGVNTVTYSANATNTTGITYSLDGSSISAGNSINSSTGIVTYVSTWNGTSTITATATGCNGPRTANHTVTITPTVGTPVFSLGLQSVRTQAAGTVIYSATSTNNTGISYSLDPASVSGGSTINSSTGAVTWAASWFGTSVVTATATGCNGPVTSVHIANINPSVVQSPLYLSTPGQILDRIDPVATGITTTVQSAVLASTGTASTTFTLDPALCNDLTIKAQTIAVVLHLNISSGTMPVNPNITATIRYGATTIINLTNPVYNSSTGILSWSAILGADVTVPTGQMITLTITTAQPGVTFRIDYHSMTKPSRVSLFPVSTFIDFLSFDIYNAPYPGGSKRISGNTNTTYYARSVVTTPFGYRDITGMEMKINPPGNSFAVTCVDSTACTRTYEYAWTTTSSTGTYYLLATAKEGYENIIKNSELLAFDVCTLCGPVALNDSAKGAGGTPLIVDVTANDYDPNKNINASSLSIFSQPNNGTGFVSNNKIVYLPNGSFAGKDTLVYQICDSTNICTTASVFFDIDPLLIDQCSDATRTHTYFVPYPENDAFKALLNTSSTTMPSNNIRTVISLTIPYPGMSIVWDHWEDGYEINPWDPLQTTTKVWGDGNPYNGIAPGYANDIIPAGGSIILDNTMPANPRVSTNIFYDGRDKITSSGQIAMTQVSGEPTRMPVQAIKTNITSTFNFGQSFTIPLGQNFPSRDFRYTGLFVRAELDGTIVEIDKDNNGSLETTFTLNQGESYLVDGGVNYGATVTSNKPIGVELNAGGVDQFSIRNASIYPATWYSHTYYSPVPTSDNPANNPKDSSVVMLYNSLNRPITISWQSGVPGSGTINLPAKGCVRFPLIYSATAAYKFFNPTGESFTAIEIIDSYTPGGGGNDGQTYDWSFNLIAESRLTDFATTAWAPGGLDLVAPPGPDVNGNPVWVTANMNTTLYVKWDGNVSGTSGLVSPCGLRYDVAYTLNALNYVKLRDMSDNDQSGLAIYTCNGAKIAAVYGADPQGSGTGIGVAYWDVGSTIIPFCKQKLIFANDDYARTIVNQPVTIPILLNDFGFLAVVDPASVTNTALLKPKNGTVSINSNGTVIYTPDPGYVGKDRFEYNVCSTPSPVICDIATVYVDISNCPAPYNQNVIAGTVFLDRNDDGINNDGGGGVAGAKVYLYVDGNCNGIAASNELSDSVTVDGSGSYQFISYPEKFVEDNFDDGSGGRTCANGTDGNTTWLSDWTDIDDAASPGLCNAISNESTKDVEIRRDNAFGYGLRLKDRNRSATRTVNLSGASYAFLSFSYRRKSATLTAGEDIIVQASSNGSTFGTVYTIAGTGTTDAGYVNIMNQDITAYAGPTTYIRFLTNNNVDDQDTVYIDNVKIQFLRYPQCYITKLNTATVPANYHTTTVLQHNLTATSAQTCLAPYDFGIAKNIMSISGTLYHDPNGITDNLINGTPTGKVMTSPVYAYLTDSTNKVVRRTTLNSVTGVFTFPTADVFTNYQLRLSTVSVNLGDTPPPDAGLEAISGNWAHTADGFGINNVAGTGLKPGLARGIVSVFTTATNITGINFGIQRLPVSDNHRTTISQPAMNSFLTLNGGVNLPVLSGADPEDYAAGGVLTNRKVIIDSIPANAELYYNNSLVSKGTSVGTFDPSLLQVKFVNPTSGSNTVTFMYSYVDNANMKDPTPASYTLAWGGNQTLPADRLVAQVSLNGANAEVKWSTQTELNTDYYVVERSLDNSNFAPTGKKVSASGNSTTKKEYKLPDNISSLTQVEVIYYRVKLVDLDGKVTYSNVVALRLSKKPGVTIWPNPFRSNVTISITTERETTVVINLIDVNGKMVKTHSMPAPKGISIINLNSLDQLPAGVYLVEITDKSAGTTFQKLIKNN